jgi:hypothetical protein
MRMITGHLVELRYASPKPGDDQAKPLTILSQTVLQPGTVCYINGWRLTFFLLRLLQLTTARCVGCS